MERKERVIRRAPLALVPIRANARPIVQLLSHIAGPAEGGARQHDAVSAVLSRYSIGSCSWTGQACLAPLRSLHGDG